MLALKSVGEMEVDRAWQPWAQQGWTLHAMLDGRIQAVHLDKRMATVGAKRLQNLLQQLERGAYDYKQYTVFKKQTEAK